MLFAHASFVRQLLTLQRVALAQIARLPLAKLLAVPGLLPESVVHLKKSHLIAYQHKSSSRIRVAENRGTLPQLSL